MPNGEKSFDRICGIRCESVEVARFSTDSPSLDVQGLDGQTTPKCADVVDSLAERRLSRAMSPGCFGPLPEQVAARVSGITRMPPRLNPIPPHRD
jgi:hypothetical protein